jgi:hypothetical protein
MANATGRKAKGQRNLFSEGSSQLPAHHAGVHRLFCREFEMQRLSKRFWFTLYAGGFLLRRKTRPERVALDLSHHPEAQSIDVRPHDLETYDELAHSQDDDPDSEQ